MLAADKAKLEELASDALRYGHSSGKVETNAVSVDAVASGETIYKTIHCRTSPTTLSRATSSPPRARAIGFGGMVRWRFWVKE